ncbi:hypothetical protein [Paraburkholderia sp. J94]|uniref:hypothetical protein n=1 Tax=Paraburkholderia sp. J94 TaxID=2805441 RepID=UPI002AAF5DD4|nr:hypothetical protein [Paraburkholderia sp. J94]
MKAVLLNAAAVIGLFLVLVFPIGYFAFTEPLIGMVSRAAWWLGLDRNAEPGDAMVDSVLLLSFLLATACVCLVNAVARRRRRRAAHVE